MRPHPEIHNASQDDNNTSSILYKLSTNNEPRAVTEINGLPVSIVPVLGAIPLATEPTLLEIRDAILNSKDINPKIAGKDSNGLYVFYKFTFDVNGDIVLPVSLVDHTGAPYTGVVTPIKDGTVLVTYSYDICITATNTTVAVYDISTDGVITGTVYKNKTTDTVIATPTAGSFTDGSCNTKASLEKLDTIKTSIDAVKTEIIAGYTQAHTDALAKIAKLDTIATTASAISDKITITNDTLTLINTNTDSIELKLDDVIDSLSTQLLELGDIETAITTADGNNTVGQTAIISAVDSAKTTITNAINTASATLTAENVTTQAKIDAVKAAVDLATVAMNTVNTSINTAATAAHTDALLIDGKLTDIKDKLDTLITNSGNLNALAVTTNSTLASILADTTALNTKLTSTNVKLDTINTSIGSLQTMTESEFDQTQVLLNAHITQDAALWGATVREVETLVCYQSKTITRVTRYNPQGDIIDVRYKDDQFDSIGWFSLTSDQVTEGACSNPIDLTVYETTCGSGGSTVAIGATGWGGSKGTGSDFTTSAYEVRFEYNSTVYDGNGQGPANAWNLFPANTPLSAVQDWVNSLGLPDYFYIAFNPALNYDVEVYTATANGFTSGSGNSLNFANLFGMNWDSFPYITQVEHTSGGRKALLFEQCKHPIYLIEEEVAPSSTLTIDHLLYKDININLVGAGNALIYLPDMTGTIVPRTYTESDTLEVVGQLTYDLQIDTDANIMAQINFSKI